MLSRRDIAFVKYRSSLIARNIFSGIPLPFQNNENFLALDARRKVKASPFIFRQASLCLRFGKCSPAASGLSIHFLDSDAYRFFLGRETGPSFSGEVSVTHRLQNHRDSRRMK